MLLNLAHVLDIKKFGIRTVNSQKFVKTLVACKILKNYNREYIKSCEITNVNSCILCSCKNN